MALALVLGFTQCKKDQPTPQTQGVRITLNVNGGNSNSRVIVDPTGHTDPDYATVTFEAGDVIYVGNNGHYCGYLEYDGNNFTGTISDENLSSNDYLHFYFLGGKGFTPTINETDNTATVVISDQSSKYPVISYSPSKEPYQGERSYSAKLQNKVSIMKFNVITPSTAPICITGMNNTVSVDFATIGDEQDNGFSYSQTDDGVIKMAGGSGTAETPAVKWAIVLPQEVVEAGDAYSDDHSYIGTRPAIEGGIGMNQFLNSGLELAVNTQVWDGNLSTLTGEEPYGYATATDGMTITGTLTANSVQVFIADGANVTLQNATINGQGFSSYNYAGLNLLGSANITLVGTSTMSGGNEKAGIYAPVGGTLTISGDGTINATGGQYAAGIGSNYLGSSGDIVITDGSATINATGGYAGAGIGSGYKAASECGNIEITDSFTGTVNATDHYGSPGIGSGNRSSCGSITISGGTINATGEDGGAVGNGAPGIGSGIDGSCGAITINESVTLVTAVKGNSAPCCIGKGSSASCGTITIGGTEYPSGATPNQGDGLTFVYPVPAPVIPAGAINSIFNVGTSASPKYVYFSQGNLQYSQSADKWSFMEHQYDMVETTGMNVGTNYADQDIVSLFGWGTGNNPTKTGGGAAEYENYTEWGTNTIYSGTTATTNWRTLTRDEWDNLFANHQYGYVMISNGSQWICGVAIDPSSTTTLDTSHSHWSNNIYWTGLDAFIADAEAGGWLFLPAAGLRTGTSVANVSDPVSGAGYYWSSTKEYDSLLECYQSNYLLIKSNDDAMINRNLGFIGHSVRLVKDAE